VKAGKTTVIRRTLRSVRMPNSVRHLETRRQLFPRGTCLIGTVGACQVLSRADHCVDRLVLGGSLAFLSASDAFCENDSCHVRRNVAAVIPGIEEFFAELESVRSRSRAAERSSRNRVLFRKI